MFWKKSKLMLVQKCLKRSRPVTAQELLLSKVTRPAAQSRASGCAHLLVVLGAAGALLLLLRFRTMHKPRMTAHCLLSVSKPVRMKITRCAHLACDDLQRRMQAVLFARNPCVHCVSCHDTRRHRQDVRQAC